MCLYFPQGTLTKQECIPVGCVPPTTVAVCWGVPAPRGVCSRGWLLPGRGVCSGESACSRGESACSGGCLLPGGSQNALRQTPPRGQTHTCKNITFATSLRTVIKQHKNESIVWLHCMAKSYYTFENWLERRLVLKHLWRSERVFYRRLFNVLIWMSIPPQASSDESTRLIKDMAHCIQI